jgi:CheY-like chemotaxis protein
MLKQAILCVDDEPTVLRSLREQIGNYFGDRYLYEIAESVEEAWEIIEELSEEEVKIIIVISDWLMPGVKGDEFLIAVHQHFPDTITIMLTGQADIEAIERTRIEADLHAYIAKPWTEETLLSTIESGFKKLNI